MRPAADVRGPRPTAPTGIRRGCRTLARVCAALKPGERALVLSEPATRSLGAALAGEAAAACGAAEHLTIAAPRMHGAEPRDDAARRLRRADVVFCLTRMSLAHSRACRSALARGARWLSLPDYSAKVLEGPALTADFRALSAPAERLAAALTAGSRLEVFTEAGTSLTCLILGRRGNPAPGWCPGPGTLASPPDAEVNIAPVEGSAEGVVVVDGSIPHPRLGLLDKPLRLNVREGRIVGFAGPLSRVLEELFASARNPDARMLGEVGLGLNPRAALCGSMLEDEGTAGTVHFGFGSNATIGGSVNAGFHLDHVVRGPRVRIDGRPISLGGKRP
ncbi:MAG: aminopeptidase [Elusimicrobia bacterium]|nr:aminopeptidase [Elusimicrobiota bacterium]